MPAELRFLDSDGATIITSLNLGNVTTPGNSANKKLFVENFGDQTAEDITLAIEAVGTGDGDDYAKIAEDNAGTPDTFAGTTITIGDITTLAKVPFWTRAELPANLTADNNPRRYNLRAAGVTI